MRSHIVSGFTALALCSALWNPLAGQSVGVLRGTITNKETKAPVSGAVVALRGTNYRVRANGNGEFVLGGVPAGTYNLTVNAIGVAPYTSPVTIASGQTTQVEVAMIRAATNLSAVVTTASKTETEIRDVPAAVSLLSKENIEQSGATNFTEAIKTVPGVSMGSFGENFNSIQLRGLPRFGNENEAVLILLDGVPQTDARNSAQLLTLPIDNVDHVEVIKGPNSALYGRTAIGGVINIITEEPTSEQHLSARFQAGQWGLLRGTVTAAGPVSRNSQSGYLVSWTADRHDSFNDVNNYSRHGTSLFGKFTTAFDPVTQFVFTANYAINRGGTPAGDPIVAGRLLSDIDPRFSKFTNLNLPSAEYNEEHFRTMARIHRDLTSTASITNTAGYRHDLWNFINDGDFLTGPNPGRDTVILYPFTRPRAENAYYDDLRGEVTLGPAAFHNRILVGGTLDRNTGTVSTQFPFTDPVSEGIPITYLNPKYPGPAALQIIDLGSRVYEGTFLGAYAQDELGLGSRLRFVLGARYDNNRVHAVNDTGLVITAHNTKVSPKAAITLRVLDSDEQGSTQLSAYAQYSRAFKPPQAPAELAVALDPNNPLVSETITNYEAGLKGSTLDNHMAFEASVFNMLRDGVPVLQLIGTGLTFKASSAGKQRFKGIETGVTVEPVNALALHANYAFYDGKYEDFTIVDNNTTVNLSGRRVILSPRHMLDIGGVFDTGSGLGASLSGYYEGNKALDPKNTYFLGSFFIVNGRVSWRWQSYTAAVSATNILNKMYASDGEISSPLYVFPAPPRRIIGEFAIRF